MKTVPLEREMLDPLEGVLPCNIPGTAGQQSQAGPIVRSPQLSGHQQDLLAQRAKGGGLKIAEFDDLALVKEFAKAGTGIFAAPTVIEAELLQYGVRVVGRSDAVRQRFYAISVERKIKHPAVVAICEAARKDIFVAAR